MKKCSLNRFFFSAFLLFSVLCCAQTAFAAPADVLNIARLLYVDNITGLSQYTPKQGDRFAIGDLCTIYLETTGFALLPTKPDSEDEFNLDLAVDIAIKMPQRRRAIASEKDFNTLKTTVRSKISATFLAFSFLFDEEWDLGDYIIELTLRDNLSEQSVTQEITFRLEEPTEADRARQAEQDIPEGEQQ